MKTKIVAKGIFKASSSIPDISVILLRSGSGFMKNTYIQIPNISPPQNQTEEYSYLYIQHTAKNLP